MNIYIAARYSQKEDMTQIAHILREELSAIITASWLEEPHDPQTTMDQVSEEKLIEYARQDLFDIDSSDIVILFSTDPQIATVRGGRHVETGYAIACGIPIFVVGPKENIFHHLPQFRHFPNIAAVISELKGEE